MNKALTIFILCPPEDFSVLKGTLAAHALPGCDIRFAETVTALREALPAAGKPLRLVSFLNQAIVPGDILRQFELGAYNVHPGSPDYPGAAPEAWACYDQAAQFGATLHEMSGKVDEGRIIAVDLFPVPPRSHRLTYAETGRRMAHALFCSVARGLVTPDKLTAPGNLSWTGPKRSTADYQAMVRLPPDIEQAEFFRRLLSFGPPEVAEFSVTLHGYKFLMMTATGIKGHFDQIRNDTVQGWALNQSSPKQRMELTIRIDGSKDYFATADRYRGDVHDAGHGDGHSGFSMPIPEEFKDGLPHNIEVVAAGVNLMGGPRLYVFKR